MLVLSRKKGQGIVIGDATIWIRRIKGDRVSIAIDAPGSQKVLRHELTTLKGDPIVDSPIPKEKP